MEQEKIVYVNRQIAVLKTGDYLVELVDNLKPAANFFTAHLHARGDKFVERDGTVKKDESSLIQIFMRDYSKKDVESTSVYMNLEPEKIRWYHNWVSLGVKEYSDYQEKIFGKPDHEGYSIVTKISVRRQDMYNNQKKTRPWTIIVENGKGVKQEYTNGGIVCKSGSYVQQKKVTANLTDYEFFVLMNRGVKYLDATENRYMLQPMMIGLFKTLFHSIKEIIIGSGNSVGDCAASVEMELPFYNTMPVRNVGGSTTPDPSQVDETCEEDEEDLPFFPKTRNMVTQANPAPDSQKAVRQQQNTQSSNFNGMTVEEARGILIDFGKNKGKTVGEVMDADPGQLEWFANSYRGRNEKLKLAASLLLKGEKAA